MHVFSLRCGSTVSLIAHLITPVLPLGCTASWIQRTSCQNAERKEKQWKKSERFEVGRRQHEADISGYTTCHLRVCKCTYIISPRFLTENRASLNDKKKCVCVCVHISNTNEIMIIWNVTPCGLVDKLKV